MLTFLKKLQDVKMNAQARRRVFVISVGVIVLLLIVYGFLPKPVPVETAAVTRGPLRVTVEEEGRTRVKDRFVISAPVPGYLRRIMLDVGDLVTRGQKVAELEPLRSTVLDPRSRAEAEAAVSAAQASLNAAEEKERAAAADAGYARERAGRMQKLHEEGMIAKDDIEQADAEAKKAEALRLSADAAVNAAKADLERALSVLRYSAAEHTHAGEKTVIVRSPVNGGVLKLHRESEGVVNAGDPLLDIGNPGNLEVKVEVLSSDAVKIKKGTTVLFERWGGDKPLEGSVRIVEPAGFTKVSSLGVEEQRVNVIVDFTSPFEVWQKLGDGYRLDASFIIWEGKDVLQVPASALFRKGDGWALFAIESKRARLRAVVVGHRNGLTAEIISGLKEGETVITHPGDSVREGSRVRMR
jgi:HlyD family secretion protein